jgi:septum site-determining protein MinD
MERRVIFDMVSVLLEECSLHQALLKDRREPNLSLLAASQTRDKEVLTVDGVERILAELTQSFDYVGM